MAIIHTIVINQGGNEAHVAKRTSQTRTYSCCVVATALSTEPYQADYVGEQMVCSWHGSRAAAAKGLAQCQHWTDALHWSFAIRDDIEVKRTGAHALPKEAK